MRKAQTIKQNTGERTSQLVWYTEKGSQAYRSFSPPHAQCACRRRVADRRNRRDKWANPAGNSKNGWLEGVTHVELRLRERCNGWWSGDREKVRSQLQRINRDSKRVLWDTGFKFFPRRTTVKYMDRKTVIVFVRYVRVCVCVCVCVCVDSGGMSTVLLANVCVCVCGVPVCMRMGVGTKPSSQDFAAGAPCCHGDCIQCSRTRRWLLSLPPSLSFSLSLFETVQLASQPWPANHKSWSLRRFRKPSRYRQAFESACRQLFFDRGEQTCSSSLFSRNCMGNTARRLFTKKVSSNIFKQTVHI